MGGCFSLFLLSPAVLSLLPSSPPRAVVLLALLLALSFVFLMILILVNIQRGEISTVLAFPPPRGHDFVES